jgi:hypothetical protein
MNNPEKTAVPGETIKDWRIFEGISSTSFYELERRGLGPRTNRVPGTKIVRVIESHASWRERMAELAAAKAGELETARRRKQASIAGKLGAKSPDHGRHHRGARKRRR